MLDFGGTAIANKAFMIRNTLIAIYIFAVLLISAIARADVKMPYQIDRYVASTGTSYNEQLSNYDLRTRVGELKALANGTFLLVMNQNTVLPVYSRMNLTPFIGSKVMINGIEMEQQLASLPNPIAADPLSGDRGGANKIRFFVLDIKEVQ